MTDEVTLAMLGVHRDPGTAWHPHRILGRWRNLPDLDDDQVAEHLQKPEADPVDRNRDAESSNETDPDVI